MASACFTPGRILILGIAGRILILGIAGRTALALLRRFWVSGAYGFHRVVAPRAKIGTGSVSFEHHGVVCLA